MYLCEQINWYQQQCHLTVELEYMDVHDQLSSQTAIHHINFPLCNSSENFMLVYLVHAHGLILCLFLSIQMLSYVPFLLFFVIVFATLLPILRQAPFLLFFVSRAACF